MPVNQRSLKSIHHFLMEISKWCLAKIISFKARSMNSTTAIRRGRCISKDNGRLRIWILKEALPEISCFDNSRYRIRNSSKWTMRISSSKWWVMVICQTKDINWKVNSLMEMLRCNSETNRKVDTIKTRCNNSSNLKLLLSLNQLCQRRFQFRSSLRWTL